MSTPPEKKASLDPVWLAVGIGTGVAIGAATHNLGVYLPLGVVFGMFVPVLCRRFSKPDE